MTRAIFDTESNGFLREATVIWCLVFKDLDTQQVYQYALDEVEEGLYRLGEYDIIGGHNICGHDVPLIKKLYPDWTYKKLRDTYCMSKLFHPERHTGHSLESYGEQFHRPKVGHEEWNIFSDAMLYRCSEDVEINVLTYKYLVDRYCRDWDWIDSLELEQQYAINQAYQELEGVDINRELANELVAQLDLEIATLDKILLERIPKRVKQVGATVTRPFKKDGTLSKMATDWI